jgi:uncharacterized protein (TIGR02646 family)
VIRINKPKLAPKILSTKGEKKTQVICQAYTKNKKVYDSGQKKFDFDSTIYGHKTVKDILKKAQHDKCCFCESKVTHISYGDVEHFRPKAGARQKRGASLERPGYYWLAYEWSNLFFSCQLCNQRYKENLFPLKKPADRAKSHNDDIDIEKPLFIDPTEDVRKYISFREEVIFAVNDNPRGKATIRALGLDRDELNDMRRDYYDKLELIYKLANLEPPIPESKKAKRHIAKSIQSSSQYSSMILCAVEAKFEKP